MTQDARQRTLLTEQRDRLRARVRKLEADLDAVVRARRGGSDDDEHDPEGDTLSAQWSMRAGLLASARQDARQAEEAIRRFDEGGYGICLGCRRPIPEGQLEARPFRERCVACAS